MTHHDRGPWALTQSGIHFYLADPTPDAINIEDIAAGLSRTCRFNGQLSDEHIDDIYTVAQHSVYVARMVEMIGHKEAIFWALMHDAAEAYYGDMISPLKKLIPEFEALEHIGQVAVRERFEIPYNDEIAHTVHTADKMLGMLEGDLITAVPSRLWDRSTETVCDIHALDSDFEIWGPRRARNEFIKAFRSVSC